MILWTFSSNEISIRIYSFPLSISYFHMRSLAAWRSWASFFIVIRFILFSSFQISGPFSVCSRCHPCFLHMPLNQMLSLKMSYPTQKYFFNGGSGIIKQERIEIISGISPTLKDTCSTMSYCRCSSCCKCWRCYCTCTSSSCSNSSAHCSHTKSDFL